jgi:hypothetical protein
MCGALPDVDIEKGARGASHGRDMSVASLAGLGLSKKLSEVRTSSIENGPCSGKESLLARKSFKDQMKKNCCPYQMFGHHIHVEVVTTNGAYVMLEVVRTNGVHESLGNQMVVPDVAVEALLPMSMKYLLAGWNCEVGGCHKPSAGAVTFGF